MQKPLLGLPNQLNMRKREREKKILNKSKVFEKLQRNISPVQKSRAHLAGGEKRSGVIWAEMFSSNMSFKEGKKGECRIWRREKYLKEGRDVKEKKEKKNP